MTKEFSNPVDKATWELVQSTYSEIDRKYGSRGEAPRAYHNKQHTQDVVTACIAIADLAIARGRIAPSDKGLLIIAGAHHDLEQGLGRILNEQASADSAAADMRQTGVFSGADIEQVRTAIMSTVVSLENGVIVQAVGESLLGRMLADADLSNLGAATAIHQDRSMRLFRELHPGAYTGEAMTGFLQAEVRMLTHHSYLTPEAQELFPHHSVNLAFWSEQLAASA